MRYYPVYDSGTNDFLGLLLRDETIGSNAEAIEIDLPSSRQNCNKVRFDIITMYPSPKRFSYFPPVILSVDFKSYTPVTQLKLRLYLNVSVPEQEK